MSSSILRDIAELSNPNPEDFDPEDISRDYESSDDDSAEDVDAGREHYVDVSKSKLKTGNGIIVDAKYRGRTASRKDVFGEDVISDTGDMDDSNDDDEFEGSDISSDESQSEEESNGKEITTSESGSEESDDEEQDDDQQDRREKVRQMLAQETKSVAEQMSEATQADAEKGRDIKKQQRFYDNLLDARIRIQKALLALNSLPQGDAVEKYTNSETSTILKTAQEEIFTLFAKSFELRKQLFPPTTSIEGLTLKRKFEETSIDELWETSEFFQQHFRPWRDETLTKWSDKVKAASGLPVNKKFKALNQSITHQLSENLVDKEKLIQRVHTKRATFTVLGTNDIIDDRKEIINPEIFDDLDFYHPLLKDLVDRKMIDGPTESWNRQVKTKKNVKDTRASKGRKIRYHEHEKIQNFMAPVASGMWHDDQTDELFASLLGRRIQVDENHVEKVSETMDLNDGLRIFG